MVGIIHHTKACIQGEIDPNCFCEGKVNDPGDLIQGGDVFVKRWGTIEMIRFVLPRSTEARRRSGTKRAYAKLHLRGHPIEYTWNMYRSSFGSRWQKPKWRYVGTVPDGWVEAVLAGPENFLKNP
jgi:hypothetical protein